MSFFGSPTSDLNHVHLPSDLNHVDIRLLKSFVARAAVRVDKAVVAALILHVVGQAVVLVLVEVMQQGVADVVLRVDVGPPPEKELGHPFVALLAREDEQGVPVLVPGVDLYALVEHGCVLGQHHLGLSGGAKFTRPSGEPRTG